jgi:hypothetical protein
MDGQTKRFGRKVEDQFEEDSRKIYYDDESKKRQIGR